MMEYANSTSPREQQRLLIVDDSKVVRVTARKILRDHFETVEAVDGEQAWELLGGEAAFSLVISDLSMPKLDGFGLLERIRGSHLPHIRDLPVIIITGANDSEATKKRATQAGATDFIGKPFDSVHLLARTQAHASAHSTARTLREEVIALEDEAACDVLTGLANEMTFMELGYQQLAYAVRHNTGLSVFQLEVDQYGELYRTHGKDIADNIIQTVATVLRDTIREEDTAARTGTARFALLLPGLNSNGIQNLANRIRKNISERVLKHGSTRIHFTVSIGIAATGIRRDSRFDDLLAVAHSGLAEAVSRGGNTIIPEDPAGTQPAQRLDAVSAEAFLAEVEIEAEATLPAAPPATGREENTAPPITCQSTAAPLPAGGSEPAAARSEASGASPEPTQASPAPLHVPDLSRVIDLPGFDSGPLPGGDQAVEEIIEITADSNPYAPLHNVSTARRAAAASTVPGRARPGGNPGKAGRRASARQTAARRTARDGLLKRLLQAVFSPFTRSR